MALREHVLEHLSPRRWVTLVELAYRLPTEDPEVIRAVLDALRLEGCVAKSCRGYLPTRCP